VSAGDLPPPRAELDPSGALQQICRSALSRDPGLRPPTALAMADQIEAALGRLAGGVPGARQLGALVARLGEASRAARRAAIEEHVGRPGSARTTVEVPATVGEPVSGSISAPISASMSAPTSSPSPRRWAGAAIVLVVVAAAALVGWSSAAGRRERAPRRPVAEQPATPATLNVPVAAPSPAKPPAPEPDRGARPRVEKPVAKHVVVRPAAAPAVAPAAEPRPDCAHPFFVDSDGIKKYRPECM
jgi:hypothetical protein